MGHPFLTTAAPHSADLILVLEIAIGAALLLGAFLARRRSFRAHAWCQSIVVMMNAVVIVAMMIPSFSAQVYPRIPARLSKSFYALATTHAALGTLAEIAALYILLSAGTNVLPVRLRFANYKAWMRSVLVLWWISLTLGIATYIRWYVRF